MTIGHLRVFRIALALILCYDAVRIIALKQQKKDLFRGRDKEE
jgi:hypothetical protein